MRPLLALVLVLAALTAFYFAFTAGSDSDGPSGLSGPAVSTPSDDSGGTPDPAPLLDGGADVARNAVDAGPAGTESQRASVDGGGDYKNRLQGVVVNTAGAAIAGASVVLTRYGQTSLYFGDDDYDRSKDRSANTTADGRFVFDDIIAYEGYALIVSHADYGMKEVGQVNVADTGLFEEPPIVLRPGLSVSGQVMDNGGSSVDGARIFLAPPAMGTETPTGPDTMRVVSDSAGDFAFGHVSPGTYTLTVEADGYGKVTMQKVVVTDEPVEIDVELEIAQMIAGRVTSLDGRPIARAKVQAYSMPGRGKQTRSQTAANGKGEFTLDNIPAGSYTLLATAKGYRPDRKQRIETGSMTVEIQLTGLPTVEGRVVDGATGKPLTRFDVRLREPYPNEGITAPMPVHNTKKNVDDASGAFQVHCPKSGTYMVEANAEGYAGSYSDPFQIAEGQNVQNIEVKMTRGGTIKGRVVDSLGKPVSGAYVASHDDEWTDDEFMRALGDMYPTNATTRETRTKADGTFTLKGLATAKYLLETKHETYSRATVRGVDVAEGNDTTVGDILLAAGATIRGTVYDPSGQPLPGSVVQLTTASYGEDEIPAHYTAKTNSKGVYEFRHVRPGTYQVRAMRSAEAGSDPFQQLGDMKATQRKISVSDGQERNGEDFRLGS